jgi:Zn finger protein HypA/HybF involved in hydrogenase expression
MTQRKLSCADCRHSWELPYGTGRPTVCPQCGSRNIHRVDEDRGYARRGGGGRGPCRRRAGQRT